MTKEVRLADEKKAIVNRLSRIEGQIRGIKKMMQEDSTTNDILTQVSSVQNSLKGLTNYLLESHLTKALDKKDEPAEQLIELFKRFNKM